MFSTELVPRDPRCPRRQRSTGMLPRSGVSNPVSSCSKAPSLHSGTARNLSCMDLLRESPRVILPVVSILNQLLLSCGCPSQPQKQTDNHADLPSEQCFVNISQPLRGP